MRYIDEKEVSEKLTMPVCIDLMKTVFTEFAEGKIKNQLRSMAPMGHGILGVMPSVIMGERAAGAKLITVIHDNSSRGLPSHQGIVAVFDTETGSTKGIADGTSITAIRTGAVSGLATDYMANKDASVLCLIGGGVQAVMNLAAVCAVRDIKQVNVWCRRMAGSEKLIADVKEQYPGVTFTAFENPADAVRDADVICTVTPGNDIVLRGEWVKPGAHINAVGACNKVTRELDSQCVAKAKFVCDNKTACCAESGDYLFPLNEGLFGEEHLLADLGEVVTGRVAVRTSEKDITVFESLGLAEEDIICANWLLNQ